MSNYKAELQDIKAFVFDVDGVFTNGTVFLDPGGDFMRMIALSRDTQSLLLPEVTQKLWKNVSQILE